MDKRYQITLQSAFIGLIVNKNQNSRGFTLIELLVVIVIIGLLASLVTPKLFNKLGAAKEKTAKAQVEMIVTGLDAFKLDVNRYPTTD
jgi:general secretion pathway protein G